MFSTIRNILFSMLFFVLVSSVIGVNVLDKFGLYSMPDRSYLEGRAYSPVPTVSAKSVLTGEFQDETEAYMSDHVVLRDSIMLTNAALQRNIIIAANTSFSYKAFPTHFNSDYVVLPEEGIICGGPKKVKTSTDAEMKHAAESWNTLFSSFPNIHWVFYMADRAETATVLSSHDYSSQVKDYDYLNNSLIGHLISEVDVIDGRCKNVEDYKKHYYKTDHHWQIDGAINAYNSIIPVLGFSPASFSDPIEVDTDSFYGASVRSGLCQLDFWDTIRDVYFDMSGLHVKVNGEPIEATTLNKGALDFNVRYEKRHVFENMYASWFHIDYGLIEIENPSVKQGTLLIIGDSFTNAMERFFTKHYRTVYVLDPRHYDETVSSFISARDIDDALVLVSTSSIASNRFIDNLS